MIGQHPINLLPKTHLYVTPGTDYNELGTAA